MKYVEDQVWVDYLTGSCAQRLMNGGAVDCLKHLKSFANRHYDFFLAPLPQGLCECRLWTQNGGILIQGYATFFSSGHDCCK